MHVLNTLAPVFLIIALGATLRKTGFLNDTFIAGMNRFAYFVGLPSYLFVRLGQAPPMGESAMTIAAVATGATLLVAGIAWMLGRLLELTGPQQGVFVQGALRGNLAYIGLPVVLLAFANTATDSETVAQVEGMVLVALGPVMVLYNVLSVIVLLSSQHHMGEAGLRRIGKGMITNPILIGCCVGAIWGLLRWPMPTFLGRTGQAVGQSALPMALLGVGGKLITTKVRGMITPAVLSAILRVAITPLLAAAIAVWLQVGTNETYACLLLLATPTAIASYVLADQLKGDTSLAASIIVISTLASMLSLGTIVALM
jgi:predicted permease